MRRRFPTWVLVVLFVVVPVLEVYLLVSVGQAIGGWWTVALLLGSGLLGGYLVRREGARAWRALTMALAEHRMPHRELADGALVLVGGTLLLTPGFVTDVAGLLCILPLTRPLARGLLARAVARRLGAAMTGTAGPGGARGATGPGGPGTSGPGARRRPGTDESVVRGEVVDEGP